MAIPVLIIGKSGAGKSASLRNCVGKDFAAIKALNKPFPFKGKIPSAVTDDYSKIMKALITNPAKSIVIDDAGYLITNMFMNGHSNAGAGNAVFGFYNKLADHFWNLIQFIQNSVPEDKIVYLIMHEDTDDFGNVKAKTIGKLLDEKVCVEGLFTIVLRCVSDNGQHKFITQADGGAVSKSPMGMFDSLEIDNDLALVDEKIRDYYGLKTTATEEKEKNKE